MTQLHPQKGMPEPGHRAGLPVLRGNRKVKLAALPERLRPDNRFASGSHSGEFLLHKFLPSSEGRPAEPEIKAYLVFWVLPFPGLKLILVMIYILA